MPQRTTELRDGAEDARIFGQNLYARRCLANKTQAAIARMLGSAPGHGYISRIEAGRMNLTLETLARLAHLFQAPLFEFLTPISEAKAVELAGSWIEQELRRSDGLTLTGEDCTEVVRWMFPGLPDPVRRRIAGALRGG